MAQSSVSGMISLVGRDVLVMGYYQAQAKLLFSLKQLLPWLCAQGCHSDVHGHMKAHLVQCRMPGTSYVWCLVSCGIFSCCLFPLWWLRLRSNGLH